MRTAKHAPMVQCIKCGHVLPASKFWKQRNGHPVNVCKRCTSKQSKKWRDANPERQKSYRAKWYSAHPDHYHKHKLMYRYGITLQEYNQKLAAQNNACAICGAKHSEGRRLGVDHCHETGINRGLLCDRCNWALGGFRDSADLLLAAVEYLNDYRPFYAEEKEQKRRLEVLEAANWTCEDCKARDKTLEVHHCYYIPGLEPWDYSGDLLMCLCETCHEFRQGREVAMHVSLGQVMRGIPIDKLEGVAWDMIHDAIKNAAAPSEPQH